MKQFRLLMVGLCLLLWDWLLRLFAPLVKAEAQSLPLPRLRVSVAGFKTARLRGVATALLLAVLTSTSWNGAQASQLLTENFTRTDSTTVGNSWVDTYSKYKIASNTLQARATTVNLGATTLNGAVTAGGTTVTLASVTGLAANDVLLLDSGQATAEVIQIGSIATNTITLANAATLAQSHANGSAAVRLPQPALTRPAGENKLNQQVWVQTGTLPASNWSATIYLRYVDALNHIRCDINWTNATSFLQTQVYWVKNGAATVLGTRNWIIAAGNVANLQVSATGSNPTTVSVQPYLNQSGTLTRLSDGTVSQITYSVTNANSTAVQVSSATGLGVQTTGSPGFVLFNSYDTTAATVACNDANFVAGLSPYNWYQNGSTYVQTANNGAYQKLYFTGSQASFALDLSPVPASCNIYVKWSVDDGTWQTATLTNASTSLSLASNLLEGVTHNIVLVVRGLIGGTTPDLWITPTNVFRITSLSLDTGEATVAPTLQIKRLLFFTDSLGLYPLDTDGQLSPDANHVAGVAAYLGAEYGQVAFGGQGWLWAGQYNVPAFHTNATTHTWDLYFAGQSRLVGGLFSPAPDYFIVQMGTNDGIHDNGTDITASVTSFITTVRSKAPLAKIVIISPFGSFKHSQIQAGVLAANDSNAVYVDMPAAAALGLSGGGVATKESGDATHPLISVMGKLTSWLTGGVSKAFAGAKRKVQ